MKGNKLLIITSILVLAFALALTSCGSQAANNPPTETEAAPATSVVSPTTLAPTQAKTIDEVSLDDWAGVWNNYASYFDLPELRDELETSAKALDQTVDELKKELLKNSVTEFKGMEFSGNKVTFLDNFKDKGGKALAEAEYAFAAKHKGTHGGHEFFWYEFKAKGDTKYPVLLLLEVHGEETMAHYHLRYGKDAQALLAQENWYPTFVKPTTNLQQIKDNLKKYVEHVKSEPKPSDAPAAKDSVSIDDWQGTWNNMGAYLDDKEVQAGFEKLAKKEGKSVDEVKAAYKEKRACDFDGLVIENGEVTLLDGFKDKGGKPIETVKYAYLESHQVKHGSHELKWDVFKAEGKAQYPYLLMMEVHGEESLTHFHLRYGSDVDELLAKEGWYPTFVKPNSTYDQLTEEIAE